MIIVPFARTIIDMSPAAAAVKAQLGLDCGLAGRRTKTVRAKGKKMGLPLKWQSLRELRLHKI